MGKSLAEIAQQLKVSKKKVQLIYAFNGTGKTRLSREFRLLVDPKDSATGDEPAVDKPAKIIYYNAFTEDLFYWDNDLKFDEKPKLKIQPNSFTDWVFSEQGKENEIIANFQRYTDAKLTPRFNEEYAFKNNDGKEIKVKAFSEVTFSFERGNDEQSGNVKISKGEESNFIWCLFYTFLEQVIEELNVPEPSDRDTPDFNGLEYIFIDDPVSSLDENHLIELAVDVSELIKSSSSGLKFVISTHNPLFYNVMYSETDSNTGYILKRNEDGTFDLEEKQGDSNKSFSYHLHLKKTIEEAINQKQIQKYHFNLLRNLYEKTANFLGYSHWSELLPDDKKLYHKRIINFTSHSTLSNETVAEPTEPEKETVNVLLKHLINNYSFWQKATP